MHKLLGATSCLAMVLGAAVPARGWAAPAQEQIQVEVAHGQQKLAWHDEDDTLSGVLTPERPQVGRPVAIDFGLGAYYGKDQGTVRVAIRHGGQTLLEQSLVRGERAHLTFTPEEPGNYAVDLLFQSTRVKFLHLPIEVAEGEPSKWWGIATLGSVVLLVALYFASQRSNEARQALRSKEEAEALLQTTLEQSRQLEPAKVEAPAPTEAGTGAT